MLSRTMLQRIDKQARIGEVTQTDLAHELGLSPAALATQLVTARRKGWITATRRGCKTSLLGHAAKVKCACDYNPSHLIKKG